MPRITVLMACFNAGRFLEPAISSIADQIFRDWELVIVDDASTDGSGQVARGWAERDPRIRLIANSSNKGQTACLNQGLEEARGEWIARQDADDLSHPLRLSRQFEAVTARPDLVLLGTSARIIGADNRLRGLIDVPLRDETARRASCFLNPFIHTAVLFRKNVALDACGGYDEKFRIAQDYDLWSRMMQNGPAANLSARLVAYRHLAGSLSKAGASTAFSEAAEIASRNTRSQFPRMGGSRMAALASLRESDPRVSRAAFWGAFRELGRGLAGADQKDWARFGSALAFRLAGQLGKKPAAALEVFRAFFLSPSFASRWIAGRAGWE